MSDCLKLKKSNCVNCYKCIRHCPVKSIRFSGNQAHIVGNECILCGQCFVVCPQDAKEIVDSTEKVKILLMDDAPVIASIAPSFVANYHGVGIESIRNALKKLGFYDAEETAIGATIVKKEYDRMLNEDNRNILISSCCHSINLLIQKHFPDLLSYLADIVSPMQAHCLDIKKRHPEAKTVFIGPCVAKKDEADHYGDIVDAVLTFEELTQWLKNEGIELEQKCDKEDFSKARIFPTTGGILKSMDLDAGNYSYLALDGVENCISALEDIRVGNIKNCFIEMSACIGSCIGGPVMEKYNRSPIRDYIAVDNYAGSQDFVVERLSDSQMSKNHERIIQKLQEPSELIIEEILKKMGKFKPEDELNCGSCGYDTCRKKAVAIYQGKADLSMCLPFLKDKAENFSNNIINNTPNGIIVLNESLEVQQINKAARKIININSPSDVLGSQVICILDPSDFLEVKNTGKDIHDKKVYLAEYNKYVEETIIHDKEYNMIVCLLRDVTEEEKERSKKEDISRQTIEVADKVVDKQMRIVQEIASLLGETAAETKIALTKLKESMSDE
ncbi:MAG: [Fe-Fe] hydrogenase large subunit C-terminal domain-containing protein [Oscillospiraceae bacterium]|nr:[Fe-Fe] hydrogenase large subunit C-terminal domain-containing protein [Oscillospiraceae bacterium]